jgi:hypothetical protein
MTLECLEEKSGYELQVNERCEKKNPGLARYYASMSNLEIIDGCCLLSCAGNGETVEEAVSDFCERHSEETLVVNVCKPGRHQFGPVKILTPRKEQ